MSSNVQQLVASVLGAERAVWLFNAMEVDARLLGSSDNVTRAELAQAMNMVLFSDLLKRVPEGAQYVDDAIRIGRKINFDHGALRTVVAQNGALPVGQLAFERILKPLGFVVGGLYPLPRLKMTGHVYTHSELPEDIAQFFVSELHVDQFSPAFQQAVANVVGNSRDPLTADSKALLAKLTEQKALTMAEALQLLPNIVECFARQHGEVARADYDVLLKESAEMAWISTEGNAYNHVTDRVADVFELTKEQKALGRSIKEAVEVSANGRVRQTAFKAAQVERRMIDSEGRIATYTVPGSFYEFITRDKFLDEASGEWKLDLTFDSSNATGIFKMTDAAKVA
ncbi:MAG TPA: DUF1338 domain-containing protein [Permianibacter sp.]|nr:DUF1338 domain-containing protein [Permianibacter sp.]